MTARIVVLASGNGSNLQALIDATRTGSLAAQVVAVISNKPDAHALVRAADAGITAMALPPEPGESRPSYDTRLAECVRKSEPDYIVLAGWMRLLSMSFLSYFPQQVINLHPALPGEFPGTHAIERALQAHQRLGLARTGVMVHFVPDEGVDDGPPIATIEVPIELDDTIETLGSRVHAAEHVLLVSALEQLIGAARRPPTTG